MDEALPHLAPLFALNPVDHKLAMVPWNELYAALFFGKDSTMCLRNQHLYTAGQGLKQTDVATFDSYFDDMTQFFRQNSEISGALVFSRFPNDAVMAVPNDDTAYQYRDIKTHLTWISIYRDDPILDTKVDTFWKASMAKFQKTSGYDNLTIYVNYAHGDEGPEVWYGAQKLERLSRLKREWDPDQVFSWYQPIPLHWPTLDITEAPMEL